MSANLSLGTPRGYSAFSTLNPQQSQIFNQLLGQSGSGASSGLNYLQSLFSPDGMRSFEAPYLRQFNEQTIPHLAERFSSLGSGAQRSSAFGQALSSAGAGLSENLAQLHSGLQMQAAPQLIQNLQNLLGMQTMGFTPKPKSFLEELLLGLSGGTAQGVGSIGTSLALRKLGF